jgi:pimeloyl-ACP methyl ester carboxylesterase
MGDPSVSEEDLAEYTLVSPDAPHTLLEKVTRMFEIWATEPDISKQQLAQIRCPVLVVSGDDDMVTLKHTQELYEALPLGQLAVLPGTSHALVKEKPDLFIALMMQFLEDLSYPVTMVPNRRVNPISNQPE